MANLKPVLFLLLLLIPDISLACGYGNIVFHPSLSEFSKDFQARLWQPEFGDHGKRSTLQEKFYTCVAKNPARTERRLFKTARLDSCWFHTNAKLDFSRLRVSVKADQLFSLAIRFRENMRDSETFKAFLSQIGPPGKTDSLGDGKSQRETWTLERCQVVLYSNKDKSPQELIFEGRNVPYYLRTVTH